MARRVANLETLSDMRIHVLVISIALGFLFALPVAGQRAELYCNKNGTTPFDLAACEGVEALVSGAAADAVQSFERALGSRIHEFPNFKLLTPLAVAQYRTGDTERAQRTLELARITLNVFTGYYGCDEGEGGFSIRAPGARLDPELAMEAARRMCGAAYEYVYEPQPLERHLLDAWLIENFFAAREEMLGGKRWDER